MSKPQRRILYFHGNRLFAVLAGDETLSLPEIIEGQAKGWLRRHPLKNWMLEIRQHKPQHTKGRKARYYYIGRPEKRPLVTS
jgi:hypothetical protein